MCAPCELKQRVCKAHFFIQAIFGCILCFQTMYKGYGYKVVNALSYRNHSVLGDVAPQTFRYPDAYLLPTRYFLSTPLRHRYKMIATVATPFM